MRGLSIPHPGTNSLERAAFTQNEMTWLLILSEWAQPASGLTLKSLVLSIPMYRSTEIFECPGMPSTWNLPKLISNKPSPYDSSNQIWLVHDPNTRLVLVIILKCMIAISFYSHKHLSEVDRKDIAIPDDKKL